MYQESVMHVQSFCFANLNLLLSCLFVDVPVVVANSLNNMQAKGTWVFLIVRMVLAFLSEGLRAGRGKTKNDNKQMKHMMDSFEAWNNF